MSATGAAATAARHHHRKTPPSPPLTGPQVTWTGRTTRAPRRSRFPPTCARANKKARWGEPPGLAPSPLWEPLPVRPPPAHPPRPATSRTAELSVSPPPPPPPPVALASQGPHRRQTDPSGGGDNQESKKKKKWRRHHRRRQRHGRADQKGSHSPPPLAQHLGEAEEKALLRGPPNVATHRAQGANAADVTPRRHYRRSLPGGGGALPLVAAPCTAGTAAAAAAIDVIPA